MTGRVERRLRPAAIPGYWRRHVHKESARNTGSPMALSAMTNRTPARDRSDALGWRRRTDDFRAIPRSCPTRRAADSDNARLPIGWFQGAIKICRHSGGNCPRVIGDLGSGGSLDGFG
jgi:hypothetical protein